MGCLNSEGKFEHWFGNIHLSGPCNRSCYWCIGQHMMALDGENNLLTVSLKNMEQFVQRCLDRNVKEVNLTGTNTDPLMYKYIPELLHSLRRNIPGVSIGIRTNGALADRKSKLHELSLFDKISLSIHSLNPEIYRKIMGNGDVPAAKSILQAVGYDKPVKVNVVLCPENLTNEDWMTTVEGLSAMGIKKINLREPYGQAHVGNPFERMNRKPDGEVLGMPKYLMGETSVVYWDVHYVHVESVNLYANGNISEDYPITRGHDASGEVKDQSNFSTGRQREQWVSLRRK